MEIKVVFGANYGDEGKGLMTDYFSHKAVSEGKKVLNVLHNGGAQRAHTVETPEGLRHVFRHLGSGTFAGADTFITGEFMVNPIMLRNELEEMASLGYKPRVYIDDMCRITTPFDMMANQIIEDGREERLGTCGMGIWETCVRNKRIRLTIQDLFLMLQNKEDFTDLLRRTLERIQLYYIKNRIPNNGAYQEWESTFTDTKIVNNSIEDIHWMLLNRQIEYLPSLFYDAPQTSFLPHKNYQAVVFENGQGLLLDGKLTEDVEHNTPSHTDMFGVNRIMEKWLNTGTITDADTIEYCAVTRTYLTRHGLGLFPTDELDSADLEESIRIFDKTNAPNQWQGALRYARFSLEDARDIRVRVNEAWDRCYYRPVTRTSFSCAYTHADEVDIPYEFRSEDICIHPESLFARAKAKRYISTGPTRKTIEERAWDRHF